MQGEDEKVARALQDGDLEPTQLNAAERGLLDFARLVTQNANRTADSDVEELRRLGWNDQQIAEAVYIIALFAFFNRVADAFGLTDPNYREIMARAGNRK